MKIYQQQWLAELIQCNKTLDINAIIELCNEITLDDSGDTDELTQVMAKVVLQLV